MIGAFIFWLIMGLFIISYGVYVRNNKDKKSFKFWANIESISVKNVSEYNTAYSKLIIFYGIFFSLLGVPLLKGQNNPFMFITIIGVVFLTVISIAVYMLKIENK